MKKKNAFTLAEVLITLGIIGIVAAMTLPTLVQKYEDMVTVTKVKKAYSIFNQAYARAIEANGGLPKEEWDCSAFETSSDGSMRSRCYMSYMLPYMNNIRSCYVDKHEASKCTFSSFRLENDDTWYYSLKGDSMGRLGDGGGAYTVGSDGIEFMIYRGNIIIKTDRSLKNVLNQNLFFFTMDKSRLGFSICNKATKIQHYLQGYVVPGCLVSATDWILLYENLDYMRCPNNVDINGKHSCN